MKTASFTNDILLPIVRQELRKFFAHLGQMVTTGLATAVVVILFVYIFGDFLQVKLPSINPEVAKKAWHAFLYIAIATVGIVMNRWATQITSHEPNWFDTIQNFGQKATAITIYRRFFGLIAGLVGQVFICIPLWYFFGGFSAFHVAFAFIVACVSGLAHVKIHAIGNSAKHSGQSCHDSTKSPLLSWRKTRVLTNSWPGSSLRLVGSIPFIIGCALINLNKPAALIQLCFLCGGIIFAWIVPHLIAEDLDSTWIERQAAVTHQQWIGAWQALFSGWAKTIFSTVVIMIIVTTIATHLVSSSLSNLDYRNSAEIALICGFLAAFPLWLAPAFVMQIDGRRVMTNILMITLICLFLGTAIMALPLVTLLAFPLQREAHRYQGGRFARSI